ncbi:MAG: CPBP family intramembrane metalloprotease [Planctomycetaceae bacterium]|nr:CPBP family intramembrane metalloprotease [Planctomycetaceae bacterium]
MNWSNVKLILKREVRDQLRDRRTLFMVAVLPLLLYPALGIGMAQMLTTFSEQTRTVAVIGVGDLPDPPLLDPTPGTHRFLTAWFTAPEDAEKLRVITDAMLDAEGDQVLSADEAGFLREAITLRPVMEELGQVTRRRETLEKSSAGKTETGDDTPELTRLQAEEDRLKTEVNTWFRSGPTQVLIAIPRNFRARLDEINAGLLRRESVDQLIEESPRPVILQNTADEKSMIAARRVREAVRSWEQQVLEDRLRSANLPASLPSSVDATRVDIAAEEEISATLWSKMFPILLVMMAVTGAFYPAIDLGAGEKERGTMETLLISPATRPEIVLGKFFTVTLFSVSTALLNLVSMGVTSKYLLTMAGAGRLNKLGDTASFPPATSILWVVLLALPLAALFSALSLALAMFAKSNKEGQYYLTPLLMVTMGLAMFCISPSVEINPYYSVFPVVGPGLLLKALLLGQPLPHLAAYIVAVLVSSFGYSALALWWAIEQFNSEEVLFREAERFELGPWLRHVFRDRDETPSFTESGLCFVIVLMLQFASFGFLSSALQGAQSTTRLLQVQFIYLVVTVGTPPLLMAILLTRNPLKTLKLQPASLKMVLVAVALAFTLHPISAEVLGSLDWFFPPPPESARKMFASMGAEDVGWLLPLLAFAVAPALCEEFAFRGFILSGLERARNPWVPIILSSVAFGVVHMIPQQVFNAMLLGVVIALMAMVSRSLIPGIVFHFLFNGSQVLLMRVGGEQLQDVAERTGNWFFRIEAGGEGEAGLRFEWPLLLPCIIASSLLIGWLVRSMREQSQKHAADESAAHTSATSIALQRSGV